MGQKKPGEREPVNPIPFAAIFQSPIARIVNGRCPGPCRCSRSGRRCGQEEQAASHHIVFLRSGIFVRHAGAGRAVAEPGRILFFNQGETFRVSHPDSQGDDCTFLAFGAETIRAASTAWDSAAASGDVGPFRLGQATASVSLLVAERKIVALLRQGVPSVLQAEEAALGLLEMAVRDAQTGDRPLPNPSRSGTRDARRAAVEQVRLLLAREPAANLSLEDIARAVALSPFHLARVFREEVGTSIHQYRFRIRLALALDRIARGPCDLTELAFDLGFSSHSHLTRVFSRVVGMSPSRFRNSVSVGRLRRHRRRLALGT